MKTSDVLKITPQKLARMSERELSKAVSILRSTARKRYERMVETETVEYSPSAKKLRESGLLPTVKGMDAVTLRNEFKRYKSFIQSKTSTVGGARKNIKKMKEAIREITGNESVFENDTDTVQFWDLMNKLGDTEIGSVLHYKVIGTAIEEVAQSNPEASTEDLLDLALERLNNVYKKEHFSSEFFE